MPKSSRREFLEIAAASTGLMLTGSANTTWAGEPREVALTPGTPRPGTESSAGVNPFTDPSLCRRHQVRLGEFVNRGVDPEVVKAIFGRMTSLDAEPSVAASNHRLAVPYERQAEGLESQGQMQEANKAYEKASHLLQHREISGDQSSGEASGLSEVHRNVSQGGAFAGPTDGADRDSL